MILSSVLTSILFMVFILYSGNSSQGRNQREARGPTLLIKFSPLVGLGLCMECFQNYNFLNRNTLVHINKLH